MDNKPKHDADTVRGALHMLLWASTAESINPIQQEWIDAANKVVNEHFAPQDGPRHRSHGG